MRSADTVDVFPVWEVGANSGALSVSEYERRENALASA